MSNFTVPEEIPFTNDDEAARTATNRSGFPTLRATNEDECYEFVVTKEEAIVIEKGLYPGAFAVRLTCAPIDESGTVQSNLTVRHDLVLPVPNPEVEGHEAPDTAYSVAQYYNIKDSAKFPAMPTWDKAAKTFLTANGDTMQRKDADEAKTAAFKMAIKALRKAWNGIKKGEGGGFLDDTFYGRVKASGAEGQYRNLRNLSAKPPEGTTVVREGFKTK